MTGPALSNPIENTQHPSVSRGRLKIAVVGTGISGLSAAWLLNQRHDVTVYEQNDYVGGHSNTTEIEIDGQTIPVDTGFIVYNTVNYPNLAALFEHLSVPTKISEMSFSASLNNGSLEYSGTNLQGLFAQPRNLVRPRFLLMIKDLWRFYRQAPQLVWDRSLEGVSLGKFLRSHGYSNAFIYDHLMPMGAAIWSSSVKQMLAFPTLSFLRFFDNHGLVQLTNRPQWRTVCGGSREYVRSLTAPFASRIQTNRPVVRVERDRSSHVVVTADGNREPYDHIVLACHADQALRLLADATAEEQSILSNIRYQANTAVLHTDTGLMPTRRRAWASWNYLGSGEDLTDPVLCVTYLMNRLQNLPTSTPVMVTLNPCREIAPEKHIRSYEYDHPLFDRAALRSQQYLWDLQGRQNTWFCGAYFGSGFHEDGIQAGLAVAEKLGGLKRPWAVAEPSTRIGLCAEGQPIRDLVALPA